MSFYNNTWQYFHNSVGFFFHLGFIRKKIKYGTEKYFFRSKTGQMFNGKLLTYFQSFHSSSYSLFSI